MEYVNLANGWKATIYEDGTPEGKPAFWKSHGKVIELRFGNLTPKDAVR